MKHLILGVLFSVGFHAYGFDINDLQQHIIRGGEAVIDGEEVAKSTVGIYAQGLDGSNGACSGVLVDKDVVVTAAHCLQRPSNYYVFFGDLDTNYPYMAVKHYRAHRGFNNRMPGNDIGVLVLSQPAPDNFVPAGLFPDNVALPQTDLDLVGLGLTSANGNASGKRYKVKARIREMYNAAELIIDTNNQFAGTCSGDSGGPAFTHHNGRLHVLGVLSRGVGVCSYDSIYTATFYHNTWIEQTVNDLRAARDQ